MNVLDDKSDQNHNADPTPTKNEKSNRYEHIKGIIFDMDNTLLQSKIDFQAMKQETYSFLVEHHILPEGLPIQQYTTSTIIEEAVATNRMSAELLQAMWEIPVRHEVAGMHGAVLEPGVTELLEQLHGYYHLAVVTNNSEKAAHSALRDNGIIHYFDHVAGREQMQSLKPSPDGFLYILNCYPTTAADEWLSIGDSWIDGKASERAGIEFIAYRADIEKMKNGEVFPRKYFSHIGELMKVLS
ncbi:HAD family hydrolase [Paenibacillus agilis]|uniref:HAD-IA family hydrolase n=1 Tax=Paenibacillus agilis TaxID=3020863 RepID=A0A559J2E9_9BACL|nr:HAD-IA family hydrolase [Paenibacillus agilis]TVX94057.1 HAD-IA family hydrolase [Paenibacillus agilis]